jgi:hypothetical protein
MWTLANFVGSRLHRQQRGKMSESANWIQFNSPEQTSQFVDGAFELYSDLIQKLNRDEIPYFFDYWLNRLNQCDVWMLHENQSPIALVSKPKVKDVHSERWQYNTLVVNSNYSDGLDLPFEISKPIAFMSPSADYTRHFKMRFTTSYFQQGFAGTTDELPAVQSISGVKFEPVTTDNVAKACKLFDSDYSWDGQPQDYIQSVKTEITRSAKLHSGWCYVATRDSSPISVVSYIPLQVPLLGVASIVVGDRQFE